MSKSRGIITTYENGVDLVIEWKIQQFSALEERSDAWYGSHPFFFGGEKWRLWIFPNGSSRSDSSGHVDLWFGKYSSGRSLKHSFSLSLKTVKGEKYKEEHGTKVFDDDNRIHELNRFIARSELIRRKSDLVPDDFLTFICILKRSTSAGSDPERKHAENSENRNVDASTQTEEDSAQSLCEDYKKVLFGGCHHDLLLKVGDKELRAHRDILRARSKVFESMLDHDMKEKNTGVIDVPDCDPDAMELFLSYVYCGKIEALDQGNMLGLYYVADKYEMTELKAECSDFIKKSLSHTNICSVIQLALNHSDSELLDCATEYFEDNVLDILQTVEWQSFLKENSTVGNELFIKSIKKLKNVQT